MFAFFVCYPFDLYVARRAIDVGIEDTKEYSDSQSRSIDKVVVDCFDIAYFAVGRRQQQLVIKRYSPVRVAEKRQRPNQNYDQHSL